MRTVSGQKAFSYRGTKVWNMFNNDINEAPLGILFQIKVETVGVGKSLISTFSIRYIFVSDTNLYLI